MISYVLGGGFVLQSGLPVRQYAAEYSGYVRFQFYSHLARCRLLAFKSTVPEIVPSFVSESAACAFATGALAMSNPVISKRFRRNLSGWLGRNPSRSLSSRFWQIRTASRPAATLGAFLRGLGDRRVNPSGREQPLPPVVIRLGCGLASAAGAP